MLSLRGIDYRGRLEDVLLMIYIWELAKSFCCVVFAQALKTNMAKKDRRSIEIKYCHYISKTPTESGWLAETLEGVAYHCIGAHKPEIQNWYQQMNQGEVQTTETSVTEIDVTPTSHGRQSVLTSGFAPENL